MTENLPANPIEVEAVPVITHWFVDLLPDFLTADAGFRLMAQIMLTRLQQGLVGTLDVIDAADEGDPIADEVLRRFGAEMLDRGEMPPAALLTYLNRNLLRRNNFQKPRGQSWIRNYSRNIVIATAVDMTAERWGLRVHSSRERKERSGRKARPARVSASYLVAEALRRSGFGNLTQWEVETIRDDYRKSARALALKNVRK
jgi:hypothetical protein